MSHGSGDHGFAASCVPLPDLSSSLSAVYWSFAVLNPSLYAQYVNTSIRCGTSIDLGHLRTLELPRAAVLPNHNNLFVSA